MASVAKAFIGYVNKPSAFYLETIKFAIWLDMASFICFYKVFFCDHSHTEYENYKNANWEIKDAKIISDKFEISCYNLFIALI